MRVVRASRRPVRPGNPDEHTSERVGPLLLVLDAGCFGCSLLQGGGATDCYCLPLCTMHWRSIPCTVLCTQAVWIGGSAALAGYSNLWAFGSMHPPSLTGYEHLAKPTDHAPT